jgi:hypothetical protein
MDSLLLKSRHLKTLVRVGVKVLFAAALVGFAGSPALAADPKPGDSKAANTVRLVVDYGDGVETHYTALPWRKGMTVLDALVAAKAHKRSLSYSQRGSGSGTLIIKIGDVANEGGGADNRNWLFNVNGKAVQVGAGVQQLKPGDAVLWKFKVYDYNSDS